MCRLSIQFTCFLIALCTKFTVSSSAATIASTPLNLTVKEQKDLRPGAMEAGEFSDEDDFSFIADEALLDEVIQRNRLRRLRLSSTDSDIGIPVTEYVAGIFDSPRIAVGTFIVGTFALMVFLIRILHLEKYFLICLLGWFVINLPLAATWCVMSGLLPKREHLTA